MSENIDEFTNSLIKELKQHTKTLVRRIIKFCECKNELNKDDILMTLHSLKGLIGFLDDSYAEIRIIIHQMEDYLNDDIRDILDIKSFILSFVDDLQILFERITREKSSRVKFDDLFERIKVVSTPTIVLDQGYKIKILLTRTSEIKSERILALISKLKRISTVIETIPSVDDLMGNIQFTESSIVINTRETKQVISEAVSQIPELESFSITEINVNEISVTKPDQKGSLLSSKTVEIPIQKLDQIRGWIEELVLAGSIIQKSDLSRFTPSDIEILSSFPKIMKEFQDLISNIKLIPFDVLLRPLTRIVHNTSDSIGNKTKVLLSSGNIFLDRGVMEKLFVPISAIVQNSIIHGIEKLNDRVALSKDQVGTISIRATQEESEIILQISDDGRGINYDALQIKAISKGAITEEACEKLICKNDLLFLKNFSELDQASVFGGRGLGLYGVSIILKEMNGYVLVTSEQNQGSTFEIHVPLD